MLIAAANSLNGFGNDSLHKTVMFGSGAAPMLRSVCRNLQEVFVTNVSVPFICMPPTQHVAQMGSPAKMSSYASGRRCRTSLSLSTKLSMSSCAPDSSMKPAFMSRSMYTSKKASTRPREIAAPSCSFTHAR